MARTIVITGAGSGIGKAIAHHLALNGDKLVLLGRNLDRLAQTRDSSHNPAWHVCYSCDIRKPDQLRHALRQSGVDSIYGVVVNSGVGGENRYGPGDRWPEILETNLTGSYNTVQECLPYLKTSRVGNEYRKIVFISSILARLGVPGYSAYCASKAGLLGLMRSLAHELTQDGILVNALCPGWVNTDMTQQGLQGFADALKITKEEAFQKAMSVVPLGKISEPQEVARLVGYLMADDQTSITGQTIDINNGALMP
ncbi:MAG: short-chain dehydrogenase [Nitrospinae bacterium CG11_big_fil_rev_8_21_14_0_20_56_8]|nr:MAG: short-chain dehydrogenase [Nitrospinae bacterium CG11_big_fil_rev_8_21_14_0_20_56_8]